MRTLTATAMQASGASLLLAACAGQAPLTPAPHQPALGPVARQAPAPVGRAPGARPASPATPRLAPRAEPLPGPVSLGDIGSAGQVLLLGASASGAWVALCEPQTKTTKLVLGSGDGQAIDDLLAGDPSGRYVVSLRQGAAWLTDASSGAELDLSALGADVRRVRADYAEHRTLSFDANGRHVAYLAKRGHDSRIVVRTLETGSEQAFAAGPGDVFRLKLSADARYVTFEALRDDTNHNGRIDWPVPEEPVRSNACDKPSLPKFRSFAFQGRGDAVTRAVIAVETGALRDLPELVTPLGGSLLVREADGSLRLDQAGKRSLLAPSSCGGRVLFADAERGLVVATCAPPPPKKVGGVAAGPSGKRELWLLGSGYAKNLQSEVYETSTDCEAVLGARLIPLYPGSDASLLDLERRELLPLKAGSRVLATNGTLALIWRGNELYRYDALSETEARLAQGVLKNPELLQAGSTVLLSPFVIVGCNEVAQASPERALALTTAGFVLTASSAAGAAPTGRPSNVIEGPLRWVDAKVPPPDGSPR